MPLLVHSQKSKPLPNIVIIYADDMGYGDVAYHGVDDILTPNIDKLADRGVYFTQAYVSSSICSPSRCGLLSGVYQQRFTNGQNNRDQDPNVDVFARQKMLPEILKEAGYHSGIIGKWHLGEAEHLRPNKRGWNEFYGFLGGSHSYFVAQKNYTKILEYRPMYRNNEIVDFEGYTTDVFTDEAVDFIKRNHPDKTGNPFCLYVAYNAIHYPWEATDNYIDEVDFVKNKNRRLLAGMVLGMDKGIGRIVEALETQGLTGKTILIFMSDNGSPRGQRGNMSSTGPFRGWKGDCFEGGIRVPFIINWPGQLDSAYHYDKPVINLDILPTIATYLDLSYSKENSFDGVNLLPYLKGEKNGVPHEELFWKRGGDMAVRKGDWKLVTESSLSKTPMLFKLDEDQGERSDLRDKYPEKVAELWSIFEKWSNGLAKQE